ncbi:FecR family protein, partial [Bacteroides reticulotermitis]|uniref:FecR family protein n=1 Tax=Bacteroides reticulotermitis TaxID=1133319 RepID=UPI003A85382F
YIVTTKQHNHLFMTWIAEPTPQLDTFWETEISNNHELKHRIYTLKDIIKNIKIEEPTLSTDEKKLIWATIEQNINKGKVKKKFFLRRWVQAASVAAIVLLLSGGYFYVSTNKTEIELDYASMLDDHQPTQSGDISLILSDDKVVNIKNDSSEVVYDNKGRINVDSEEIKGTENAKSALNQLIVPYGKTTFLTLSDGTKIWVNSGTKLIYPTVFNDSKREIYLVGEVYLDVTRDESRPFVIKTNHIDVNVLGTKLNVSAYNDADAQSVVLVSGAVNIKSKELEGNYKIYPSQMFSYDTSSSKADIQKVDVDNYVSWIHGYLMLQSESLDLVLQKLERYFNVPFIYDSKGLKNIRVSGKLDLKGTPEEALQNIGVTAPIGYKTNGGRIMIETTSKK